MSAEATRAVERIRKLHNLAPLRDRARWVAWRVIKRNGRATKPPVSVVNGGSPARSNDPTTWASFAEVAEAASSRKDLAGLGFVLGEGDLFLDFDDVMDDVGNVDPDVVDWLDRFDTFTEVSPSGRGLHVLAKGHLELPPKPDGTRRTGYSRKFGDHREHAVYIGPDGRYFTMIGIPLAGYDRPIREIEPELLAEFVAHVTAGRASERLAPPPPSPRMPRRSLFPLPTTDGVDVFLERAWASNPEISDTWRTKPADHSAHWMGLARRLTLAWPKLDRDDLIALGHRWAADVGWSKPNLARDVERAVDEVLATPPSRTSGAAAGSTWPDPQPLPDGMPPVEPFDLAMLPATWRPWVEDVAERMQCPVDYVAAPQLVSAGAVIGRQVGIRPKRHDDWLVIPNLFGGVIGRPSLMKTPAMREAMRGVNALEVEARREHERELKEYEAAQQVKKVAEKLEQEKVKQRLKRGESVASIAAELAGEPDDPPPVRRRYVTNDATVEKMGELLRDNPTGVMVVRDELLGFLRGMEREGREQDRNFYLEAWDGCGRFTYDRIGRGTVEIDSAVVSIFGAVTPEPFRAWVAQHAMSGAGADGLLQRFQLMVWPDPPADWRNVDRWPHGGARTLQREAFAALASVGARVITDEVDEVTPPDDGGEALVVTKILRFTPEAQALFDDWRERLERRLRAPDLAPAWESHLAKYRSLLPSIALVCHLADGGTGPVGEVALMRAEAWVEYLESHARRIYDAALRPHAAAARALAAKIEDGSLASPFPLREVYRPGWSHLTTRAEAELAVEALVDAGWLAVEEVTSAVGRPATRYHVNPKCKEVGQ